MRVLVPFSQNVPDHPAAHPSSQPPVTWLHDTLSLQNPAHMD